MLLTLLDNPGSSSFSAMLLENNVSRSSDHHLHQYRVTNVPIYIHVYFLAQARDDPKLLTSAAICPTFSASRIAAAPDSPASSAPAK